MSMSIETPVPEQDGKSEYKRQERIWFSAGTLIGVIVAGMAVAVFVLTGNRDSGGTALPASSGSSTQADPAQAVTAARDESLHAAQEAVVVLNSLDYHNAEGDLTHWE